MRNNTDAYARVADWLGGSIDADDTVATAAGVSLLRSDVETVLSDVTAVAEHRDQLRDELVQQAKDHVRALDVASGFDLHAMRERIAEAEQSRELIYNSRQEERATVSRRTEERNELARRIAIAPHDDTCTSNPALNEPGECNCWKVQPIGRIHRTKAHIALNILTPRRHQAWTAVQDEGHDPGIATADLAGMVGDDIDPADAALIIRLCHPDTINALLKVFAAYDDAALNAAADLLAEAVRGTPAAT